jgi:hypothetical protein
MLTGATVETGQLPYAGGTLNFSAHPAGIYILQIDKGDGTFETHRIVIK